MPLTRPIKAWSQYKPAWSQYKPVNIPYPLSGYKAGLPRGGNWVQALEEEWAGRMGVKHAIACNSATSGLLAASAVCSPVYTHQDIAVPCFTMSATAAAPMISNPENFIIFMDCDPETYCSTPNLCPRDHIGQIIVTDLFGQCAPLTQWREFADETECTLIEDASQAPFAMTSDGKLAGTVGDCGVFSLNVHKHLQCGEGGIVVTDNDDLAEQLRGYINHGECMGNMGPGLNLRMTEFCAVVALEQLKRAESIISSRIALAEELSDMVKDFWTPPVAYGKHVYYIWAVKVPNRDKVVDYLCSQGVPMRAGYVDPLYRLKAFRGFAPDDKYIAEEIHDKELMIFEICSWDPDKQQLIEMKDILRRAGDGV